ncbi:hypothetical protein ColTof4_13562 [Colletotrichum tofieldiae]|nr:hypothetical protein ColTof3_14514 [Colletotrichum tofieldiae]GKT81139.1 hypothetical protein ColTof4_13562 [Colletotrichum tofieldiae]GKT97347.1 hypothetical protein Ct61P_15197 [Colletotrichum tofieldiae]
MCVRSRLCAVDFGQVSSDSVSTNLSNPLALHAEQASMIGRDGGWLSLHLVEGGGSSNCRQESDFGLERGQK